MRLFSIAQGNVALLLGAPMPENIKSTPGDTPEGEIRETPIVGLTFSESPNDSSECRLLLTTPNGDTVEAVFARNGALLRSEYFDRPHEGQFARRPFETREQTEARQQIAQRGFNKPAEPDPRNPLPGESPEDYRLRMETLGNYSTAPVIPPLPEGNGNSAPMPPRLLNETDEDFEKRTGVQLGRAADATKFPPLDDGETPEAYKLRTGFDWPPVDAQQPLD